MIPGYSKIFASCGWVYPQVCTQFGSSWENSTPSTAWIEGRILVPIMELRALGKEGGEEEGRTVESNLGRGCVALTTCCPMSRAEWWGRLSTRGVGGKVSLQSPFPLPTLPTLKGEINDKSTTNRQSDCVDKLFVDTKCVLQHMFENTSGR